jgi:large subunit ribosomal protein L22
MEAVAKLKNYPTSPRKMRLLADAIRGLNVEKAVSNWKQKNEGEDVGGLVVKTIFVDGARSIKRMLPAPQGRAYRMRKRSNHVTVIVDAKQIKDNNNK